MKVIRILFISIIILMQLVRPAFASSVQNGNERLDWMDSSFSSLGGLFGCIRVPVVTGLNQSAFILNLDESGQWKSTGVKVEKDKLLQIEWLSKGVRPNINKYKVMYRIDPRFSEPQVFIQKFDRATNKFVSDFHQFKNGQLVRYQDNPEMTTEQRIIDYVDYFKFNGRSKISVKKDDVINITLNNRGAFFDSSSAIDKDLGSGTELLSVYTETITPTNRIFYANSIQFCKDAFHPKNLTNNSYEQSCLFNLSLYLDTSGDWDTRVGKFKNTGVGSEIWSEMSTCSDGANSMDSDPMCLYDLGRGMVISVGGTDIKSETQKFIHSPFSNKDFFYHKSDVDGDLEFKSPWDIEGMYNSKNQLMEKWPNFYVYHSFFDLVAAGIIPENSMNFLYMGKYLMEIEIGNSTETVTKEDLEAIEVEYFISETETPTSSTSGSSIERDYRGDANSNGYIWLRVLRPNADISGNIQVRTANYTGSTEFSDIIYYKLLNPLRDRFNELSEIIYRKLVSNPTLQNIAKAMLIIYIIIYGLMFLAGATQITITDIVVRVLKIGVIIALFSENSWTFFNNNLFNVFIDGTEYLMSAVVGTTSSVDNIFGFIDPVISKYTNGTVWQLLFIQLLQIHNGLTFFAMMTIYSILIFFRALLQVIVGYCLAFLGLAVMISLAPFFIILILFERTKSMFDNWMSTIFSYMIQPTVLLIFFLLIDQIMGDVLLRTLVDSCWGILIPIKIGLDLNHISIPMSFSFTLPFFPGVPFFIPEVKEIHTMNDFFFAPGTFAMIATSSFLFFALCKLADGLVDYVTLVVEYLTNVQAARQDGKLQSSSNPTKSIINDMTKIASPITGAFKGAGKFIKSKGIDQKISRKGSKSSGGEIDYSSVKKPEIDNGLQKPEEKGDAGKNKLGSEGGGATDPLKKTWKPGSDRAKSAAEGVVGIDKGKATAEDKIQSSAGNAAKQSAASSTAQRAGVKPSTSIAQTEASKGSSANRKVGLGNGAAVASGGGAGEASTKGADPEIQRQDITKPEMQEEVDSSPANASENAEREGVDNDDVQLEDQRKKTNVEKPEELDDHGQEETDKELKNDKSKTEKRPSAKLKGKDD